MCGSLNLYITFSDGPEGEGRLCDTEALCVCEVCLAVVLSGSIYRAARWEKWQVGSDERGWSVTLVNVKLQSNSRSRETLTQISPLSRSQSSGSVCQDKVFLSLHSMFISFSVHLALLSSALTAFSALGSFLSSKSWVKRCKDSIVFSMHWS